MWNTRNLTYRSSRNTFKNKQTFIFTNIYSSFTIYNCFTGVVVTWEETGLCSNVYSQTVIKLMKMEIRRYDGNCE